MIIFKKICDSKTVKEQNVNEKSDFSENYGNQDEYRLVLFGLLDMHPVAVELADQILFLMPVS